MESLLWYARAPHKARLVNESGTFQRSRRDLIIVYLLKRRFSQASTGEHRIERGFFYDHTKIPRAANVHEDAGRPR